MQLNSFFNKTTSFLFYSCLILCLIFPVKANAVYDNVRGSSKFDNGKCQVKGFEKFDPFKQDDDMEWVISNPICASFLAGVGATMFAANKASQWACKATNAAGLAANARETLINAAIPSFPPGALNPMTYAHMIARQAQVSSRLAEASAYEAAASLACPGEPASCTFAKTEALKAWSDFSRCSIGNGVFLTAVGASITALSIIWDTARISFDNAQICGHEWQAWELEEGEDGDEDLWVLGRGKYRKCIENLFTNNQQHPDIVDQVDCEEVLGFKNNGLFGIKYEDSVRSYATNSKDFANKFYREFVYGGKEFVDNSDGACDNPGGDSFRQRELGYKGKRQRYYYKGPGQAPNYACDRFLILGQRGAKTSNGAYECCKKKSQSTMCIENRAGMHEVVGDLKYEFCQIGKTCSVANVIFDIYESKKHSNYLCAETYSVCPYNHPLGGGTEEVEYKEIPEGGYGLGEKKNFCQYLRHCIKVPVEPTVKMSSLDGEFIAASCRDLKGDSQNTIGYSQQLSPVKGRNFTAPMAQCFKETMENIFLNKAGSTLCSNPDETPDENNRCPSGEQYIKGEKLPNDKSIFRKIQDSLRSVIKMGLVVSIVVFGFKVLIGVPKTVIEKKVIMSFLLKITLVMYFALGDAWQDKFAENILGVSSFMSELTFRVDEEKEDKYLDGCQFPRYNHLNKDDFNTKSYAPRNQYLRVWDTFDCKLALALGFGPEVSVPNLFLMILAGLLTAGVGILFVIASFFFAFLLIEIAIKALHIFLLSTTAVVILLYVSPITITLAMFERTKGIFSGWWKQLLGFTLQPMILFAYLGIMLTIFDSLVVGGATFTNNGPGNAKTIVCNNGDVSNPFPSEGYGDTVTVDTTLSGGNPISGDNPFSSDNFSNPFQDFGKSSPSDTSLYCIFNFAQMKTWRGFEPIGIGLPMLLNMNQTRVLTIIKAALVVFILMKFMDRISVFAKELVGGASLSSDWKVSAFSMAEKGRSNVRAVQKRAGRALLKHGSKIARAGMSAIGNSFYRAGTKGKAPTPAGTGSDSAGNNPDQLKSTDSVSNSGTNKDSSQSQQNRPDGASNSVNSKDSSQSNNPSNIDSTSPASEGGLEEKSKESGGEPPEKNDSPESDNPNGDEIKEETELKETKEEETK